MLLKLRHKHICFMIFFGFSAKKLTRKINCMFMDDNHLYISINIRVCLYFIMYLVCLKEM